MRKFEHDGILKVSVALGALHAVLMTVFALGQELAPLAVWLVDFPLAYPLVEWFGLEWSVACAVSIVGCSILYPSLFYWLARLIGRQWKATVIRS